MKIKILSALIIFTIFVNPGKVFTQSVNSQDSLALVDLYNSTNGSGWINSTNWLTAKPLSTWYGATVANGRVTRLELYNNKLTGNIPMSLGNLSALNTLDLKVNQLSGNIPFSLGNLATLFYLDLSYNQFSSIGFSMVNSQFLSTINLYHNRLSFSGIEQLAKNTFFQAYSFQADIPLIENGNILSVAAGGTLSNNTYNWYKDGVLVSTKTGDSTFSIAAAGNYSVTVNNSIATRLTLYSITPINVQDSLTLVDLYNTTNGTGWINSINWLTTAPVATWYGVTVRNSRVTDLQLFSNKLSNSIPTTLGNLSNLLALRLDDNQLSGAIPSSLQSLSNLAGLQLNFNQLSGDIPSSLGNLNNLKSLSLDNNQLSGNIPASLGNLTGLTGLYLNNNLLTGSITSSLGSLTNLMYLSLNNNQLTGSIPATLANLANVYDLILNNNQLSDSIPSSLGKLANLQTLRLSNNQLSGVIPDSLLFLTKLFRLELSNNQLSGSIPDSLGKLSQLGVIFLNNNQLSGSVPSLLKINYLSNLNLANNFFTFTGLEYLPVKRETKVYSPQAAIPLHKHENLLSVSAGGTLANDTFRLFKDDLLIAVQPGDSVFAITNTGKYYVTVTNNLATELTLYSDTLTVGITLSDTTTTVAQNITGNSATDINNTIFKLITITPTAGANALNGNVITTVVIDSVVSTFKSQPYVQRHYDIVPSVNANNAEATITLYFTQQEFDNFNTYVTTNSSGTPLLPTGGVDNGSVRIIQFHGTFTGTSNPGNYADTASVFITPNVVWDNANNWWVVTFPVSGFSGFYLSTANFVLPVTLLQFKGQQLSNTINLEWLTTNEINSKEFIIEHSNYNLIFSAIGRVSAISLTGNNKYSFVDTKPTADNNFYRLKTIDKDNKFSYSNIISIKLTGGEYELSSYPNPAVNITTLSFSSNSKAEYIIEIGDALGNIIKRLNRLSEIGINKINIDLYNYSQGTYIITLINKLNSRHSLKLIKR